MNNKKQILRRNFIKHSLITSASLAISPHIVYAKYLPADVPLIGLQNASNQGTIPGKSTELVVLNDKPINAETPAHLLNAALTPNDLFFVRNNGIPPQILDAKKSQSIWKLHIEGESIKQKTSFSIADLKSMFEHVSYNLTLECGGNGRAEFMPPAQGNQWSTGAVGCAKWTGVRIKDVLNHVGIKSNAVYLGYYGADTHLSGDTTKEAISRGVPIIKAMEEESLIAWAMNDQDIPLMNGFPLRLVFGGYPASCSGKWLNRITIRNKIHDGQKMGGSSYKVPCNPVEPGAKVEDKDMCIIENMPVKSLISYPKTGATMNISQSLPIEGKAWTSAKEISSVFYSIDFGMTWEKCALSPSANKYAWQIFKASIKFPKKGYYEVWARAVDSNDQTQSIILNGWNPKGYLNNACHRIAIKVT